MSFGDIINKYRESPNSFPFNRIINDTIVNFKYSKELYGKDLKDLIDQDNHVNDLELKYRVDSYDSDKFTIENEYVKLFSEKDIVIINKIDDVESKIKFIYEKIIKERFILFMNLPVIVSIGDLIQDSEISFNCDFSCDDYEINEDTFYDVESIYNVIDQSNKFLETYFGKNDFKVKVHNKLEYY